MKYLVAIHHPDTFTPSMEDQSTIEAIDKLNDEMIAAGVRVVALGLKPVQEAKSLKAQADGSVMVTDGPYLETKEHMGGFWILEVANEAEALEWGRKAVIACRTPVEVRAFYGSASEIER